VRGITRAHQSPALADVAAVTLDIQAASYRPESYSFVDLQEVPIPSASSMNEFHFVVPTAAGEEVQVFTSFAKLLVSEQALVNDDREFIRASLTAFNQQAARNELKRIVNLLESTANLSEGAPLFGSDNAVSGGTLDAAGLGAAMSKLRQQPTESGEVSGSAPAVVAVHPDDEYSAKALAENLPAEVQPRVVVLPTLANSDDYFVMAEPASNPVIGRTRLAGSEFRGVTIGAFEPASRMNAEGNTESYPGVAVPMSHTVGLNVVSRVDVVRVSKS
jgi:hypothetical protein